VDPDPANKEAITAWVRNYWEALHPFGAGGTYLNFMMKGEGEDRIRATYQDNYERLVRLKTAVRGFVLVLAFASDGCEKAPLRGQQP
jgi:hypothetical protein